MGYAFAPYTVFGDLATLLNYGQNRIFIYDYNGTFLVSALIISDFNISGNSDWSDWGPRSGGGLVDLANKAIAMGSSMANLGAGLMGMPGMGVTKPQIKSPWQTVVDWGGSGTFSLNLDLLFLSLTPDENAKWAVHQMMRCVYPEITAGGTMVIPPLQYARVPMSSFFGASTGTWGCVGLKIGSWFEAPPVFVVTSANFSMSKEQTPEGLPLYANGTINVMCSHLVSASHIQLWLGL